MRGRFCIHVLRNRLLMVMLLFFASSHMDFEPEWDERMIEMWDLTENEYAVLSTYVANIGK